MSWPTSTFVILTLLAVFVACCVIWGIQVGICALAAIMLAEIAVSKLTPHSDQSP